LNQRFAIEAPTYGLVGTANLVNIDWKNNHAVHGMMLGNPDTRGKGLGVDAIMAIMRYAFDELHFARLDGSMIEYNTSSLRVYCDKCGWQVEGRQRSWYFRKGRYWDKIVVGVTRSDYDQQIKKTKYWD
jgi:RimJ/RimL family protein N-acetyltransferase